MFEIKKVTLWLGWLFFYVLFYFFDNCQFYTMQVNDWFKNGKDYQEGVLIYSKLTGAKPNLTRLFFKKKSAQNEAKLLYELEKYRTEQTSDKEIEENTPPEVTIDTSIETKEISFNGSKNTSFYRLHELPVELHEKSIKQRTLFQKAISLKILLNSKEASEENASRTLCLQIEDAFDEIEAIQKELRHYIENRVLLDVSTPSFKDLTPALQLQRRNGYRSTLSKQKARLKKLDILLANANSIAEETRTKIKIEKAEAKIIELSNNIISLTNLIQQK